MGGGKSTSADTRIGCGNEVHGFTGSRVHRFKVHRFEVQGFKVQRFKVQRFKVRGVWRL
jgi:hypothetical protein